MQEHGGYQKCMQKYSGDHREKALCEDRAKIRKCMQQLSGDYQVHVRQHGGDYKAANPVAAWYIFKGMPFGGCQGQPDKNPKVLEGRPLGRKEWLTGLGFRDW